MTRAGSFAVVLLLVACGCTGEKQRVCNDLGDQYINRMKEEPFKTNYTNLRTQDFYSSAIDACIHTEESIVGVNVQIRDTSNGLLKDGGLQNLLLHCDADGADSVIISKVREHRGAMSNVTYSEWVDDGFGGSPRALKTPREPYTREQCKRVFDKWVAFLKQTG